MENNQELARLEEFIDNLLAKYRQLKKSCTEFEQVIEARDAKCAKLEETIAELRQERKMVGDKVNGLLHRIEKWESELESGESPEESGKEAMPGPQGSLFQKTKTALG